MKYRKLKEFFNSLTEEQLDQEVFIEVPEYRIFKELFGVVLQEDWVDPYREGDGAYPVSAHGDEDTVLTEDDVVFKKGQVHLVIGE